MVGFCAMAIAVQASLSSYNTNIACCGMPRGTHELSFYQRLCNCGLKFRFICNGTTGKSKADSSEGVAGLGAHGPVGVHIAVYIKRVMNWAVVREDIMLCADQNRVMHRGEAGHGLASPEVDAVFARDIKKVF